MAKESENALVVKDTDGTVYNLLEAPDKDSKYVVAAHEKLIERLQINELAADLTNVGKFLLMAHCGVMGHLQLEIKVRERLQSVVKLCDDTVFTLNEFDRASDSAISNMASAYEYLLEGFEDIALETLQEVGEISQTMAVESSKLEQRFGNEATEVENVHKETKIERYQVEKANKETKKSIETLNEEKSLMKKHLDEKKEEEEKAVKELDEIIREEHETIKRRREATEKLEKKLENIQEKIDAADVEARMACNQASTGFWAGFGSTIVHAVGGKTKDDIRAEKAQISYSNAEHQHKDALLTGKEKKDTEDKTAETQRQLRELLAKELEERRRKREQARKEMAEVARKLTEAKFEEDIQKESLFCLHHALTALQNLQSIMQLAEKFWRETHSACNAITGHAMTKRIASLKAMDEEKRKKLWNARGLKMEAVKYYAQWVAIQQMCSISRVSLTNSQRQVHMFIRQNPTKEDGKKLLERLAKELAKLDPDDSPEQIEGKKDN